MIYACPQCGTVSEGHLSSYHDQHGIIRTALVAEHRPGCPMALPTEPTIAPRYRHERILDDAGFIADTLDRMAVLMTFRDPIPENVKEAMENAQEAVGKLREALEGME